MGAERWNHHCAQIGMPISGKTTKTPENSTKIMQALALNQENFTPCNTFLLVLVRNIKYGVKINKKITCTQTSWPQPWANQTYLEILEKGTKNRWKIPFLPGGNSWFLVELTCTGQERGPDISVGFLLVFFFSLIPDFHLTSQVVGYYGPAVVMVQHLYKEEQILLQVNENYFPFISIIAWRPV